MKLIFPKYILKYKQAWQVIKKFSPISYTIIWMISLGARMSDLLGSAFKCINKGAVGAYS